MSFVIWSCIEQPVTLRENSTVRFRGAGCRLVMVVTQRSSGMNCRWNLLSITTLASPLHARDPVPELNLYLGTIHQPVEFISFAPLPDTLQIEMNLAIAISPAGLQQELFDLFCQPRFFLKP